LTTRRSIRSVKLPKTYAEAGVDVSKVRLLQSTVAKNLMTTFVFRKGRFGSAAFKIGHYAGLINVGQGRLLALHVDGVGTKVMVAQLMGRYDTVGIDCIAMNVNDIICMGAEPIAFLDYIALKEPNDNLVNDITLGLVEGARQASVAIVGGETAILSDLLSGGSNAFDLAGSAIGIVSKSRIITGSKIKPKDIIVGIESSGIHSNGLTLARRLLLTNYKIDSVISPLERSLGEELLEPTRIYVKPVLELLRKRADIRGIAHITGGAFSKLKRLTYGTKLGFDLNSMPEPLPIFTLIQKKGRISTKEMYNTFNMGIGLCIVTEKSEVSLITKTFNQQGFKTYIIGSILDKPGIYFQDQRIV
jgi:phosphoribosylformylglycinamidine cyclo-ligase